MNDSITWREFCDPMLEAQQDGNLGNWLLRLGPVQEGLFSPSSLLPYQHAIKEQGIKI